MKTMHPTRFVCLLAACLATSAQASPLPRTDAERACWQRYTRERTRLDLKELTAVSFTNLRSGYRVRSPFLVEFGIKGMGVVPAGKALPGTGHHHILVNTRMPPSVSEKLPFNDGHRHFGKGQTFAVLDLPPGRHTLRLLFADHEHRPYFVFSPEISVEVIGKRSAELGYVPNQAARSLVTRRTDTIALVASEPDQRVFGDPFFGDVVRGVSQEAMAFGLQITLLMAQSHRDLDRIAGYLTTAPVDGVLLVSGHVGPDPLPAAMVAAGIPVVIGGRPLQAGLDVPSGDNDNVCLLYTSPSPRD